MLDDILVVDLFHIEDGLGGVFSLDPEVDIVPMISSLPKLSVRHHIGVKSRDKCNVSQQEEMLACRRVNVDLDVAISFHIGAAVSS